MSAHSRDSVGPHTPGGRPAAAPGLDQIIPQPVEVVPAEGKFRLKAGANIYVEPEGPELLAIGQFLADRLNPASGLGLRVLAGAGSPARGSFYLTISEADPALGEEGYQLNVTEEGVVLRAYRPAGLFYGVQTIRQLLPAAIEGSSRRVGPWVMATGVIRDYPRYAWRGFMLDVARHFFSVADVKRLIDRVAYYKMNRFHLHLTDDQGWRIEIKSWPRLAAYGGSKAVNDDPGGSYSQADYAEIAAYASSRYITLIPEIEMPGHSNAALASYGELNQNDTAPDLYTGIEVGFSSFCVAKDVTYRFVDAVVGEIAALTPGPYIHIGGDESAATKPEDYVQFVERVQAIVRSHGKQMIGWEEINRIKLDPTTIVQSWKNESLQAATRQGAKVILSPGSRVYLDMQYDESTPLGLHWAGYVKVKDAYLWDPENQVPGVSAGDILGIEACLWSETLRTMRDIDYLVFPRLPGAAEMGWSPAAGKDWAGYSARLGSHGARLAAMGIDFYRSTEVTWDKEAL